MHGISHTNNAFVTRSDFTIPAIEQTNDEDLTDELGPEKFDGSEQIEACLEVYFHKIMKTLSIWDRKITSTPQPCDDRTLITNNPKLKHPNPTMKHHR